MITFEINKTYKDNNNNSYTILNRKNDIITVKFNKIIKNYHVIDYNGVESVIQYGKVLFRAAEVKFRWDNEIDSNDVEEKINKSKMGYIDVIRRRTK